MRKKRELVAEDGTIIVGAPAVPLFRNLYHVFLRAPWWQALGGIVVAYLSINVLFGAVYFAIGGIANMREGSFFDAFVFSVQTIATIGYGSMAPATAAANVVVIMEAVVGLLITAVSTGLVFAKFTLAAPMIRFARNAVIATQNGKPTLVIRLGNMRGNFIVEATARVSIIRTERTSEGEIWYRMVDVPLTRDRTPALTRSWSLLHVVDEKSPLFGADQEALKRDEVEVIVSLMGVDDTSMQQVHARKRYVDTEVLFGRRYADMLSARADGKLVLDVERFDDVIDDHKKPDDARA
jgi:inward rectifier potassium channel